MTPSFANPQKQLRSRHRTARAWQTIFLSSTIIAIIALVILLATIIDQSFGLVVIENKVPHAELSDQPLDSLNADELISLLRAKVTKNRIRTLERDNGPLADMDSKMLYSLVIDNVVQPQVVESYNLWRSITDRQAIEAQVKEEYPQAQLEWHNWLNSDFLTSSMSPQAEKAGVRTAWMGSLYLILITIVIAFPIGVGAAIYLEEYADAKSRINRIIQVNIDNLAGVPSIVYGILGLAIFVRALVPITSGAVFGVEDSSGRTILSAGLTMALLILPVIIINSQEAIRAVPRSLREASYGLGATQWQTIWHHVLPAALPGILTGAILAISRAIGETAPLILVGASTLILTDPDGPFSKFTALPIQIYNWTARPQAEFRHAAAAAILILLITLLSMNAVAILLRNRFSRR